MYEGRPRSISASALPVTPRKFRKPRDIFIAEGILLEPAQVHARLDQVLAARPGGGIGELVDAGGAVLRVVGLIAERGVAEDGNLAEAEIARVGRDRRKAHLAVQVARHVLLEDAGGDAVEAEPEFVHQVGREDVGLARHRVLRAPRNVISKAGDGHQGGSGERFEQAAVAEAVAKTQCVRRAEVVVEAQVEVVVAVALRGRGDIILSGHGPVGKRVQRRDGQSHGVETVLGNHVAGERRLGERIDGVDVAARKIAHAFERGRNVGDPGDAFAHAPPFVVGEDERAVADHGTAERAAELVALILRAVFGGRSEEVAGVGDAIAEELVGGSVDLVGAALQHHVDLPAGIAAGEGVVGAGGHLELAHGVHRRSQADAIQLGVAVEHAIQDELVGVLAGAVDVDGEIAAHRTRRTGGGRHDARQQQTQLEEIAAVERQARNLAVIDDAAQRGRFGAQQARAWR